MTRAKSACQVFAIFDIVRVPLQNELLALPGEVLWREVWLWMCSK